MAVDPHDRQPAAANADGPTYAAASHDERHAHFKLDVGSPSQAAVHLPPAEQPPSTPLSEKQLAPADASQATLAPFAEFGGSTSAGSPVAAAPPKVESTTARPLSAVDIEHVYVDNDPREWSLRKKYFVTFIVSIGALTPTLAAS
jgi:hypothetical protein